MAKETNERPLSAPNNATYKVVDGVTYFKLKSEFPGDYTKNCGLLGNEIDENFYFLRGYDIESVDYDQENKTIIITRVDKDYDPMEINIGEEIVSDRPEFSLNKENGTLVITYPDGEQVTVDGFLIEGTEHIRVASDSSLIGNGTTFKPLGLSPMWKTGTFAPADDFIDLVENEEDWGKPLMDAIGHEVPGGYRIVSKEKMTKYGFLYPYEGVERIAAALEEEDSPWRIPTKEDWDELLNSMEEEQFQNHSATTVAFLGDYAGSILKSTNLWKESQNEIAAGIDSVKFNVLPVGGVVARNSWMRPDDNDIEGFGDFAGFWTTTPDADGSVYTKIFTKDEAKVGNEKVNKVSLFSIRLVKDYNLENGLDSDNEDILGFTYPVAKVQGRCKPYAKVWTLKNFYNDPDAFGGKASDEWLNDGEDELGLETAYYVNEWDGARQRWFKRQLREGESIVLLNKGGEEDYHEYRLVHGELVDTLQDTEDYVNEITAEFTEKLETLSSTTIVFSAGVVSEIARIDEAVSELSASTAAEVERLDGEIARIDETVDAFSASTEAEIERLDNKVDEFSAATEAEIERLDGKIDELSGVVETFSAGTVAEVERLDGKVDELSAATESEIGRLDGKVDEFSAGTIAEVERLDSKIDELSGSVETFSADTVNEFAAVRNELAEESATRAANDIVPGTYTLTQSGATIPTSSEDVEDVKIEVDENFFFFGDIISDYE